MARRVLLVFVVVEMSSSISLERGQDGLAEVRRRLLAFPEVLSTPAKQGRPKDGLDNETTNVDREFGPPGDDHEDRRPATLETPETIDKPASTTT